jgi:hypothetical protein
MTIVTVSCTVLSSGLFSSPELVPAIIPPAVPIQKPRGPGVRGPAAIKAAVDPDDAEEEELGDEEDLAVAQPLADEESSFDDFDDEFDDDFEEEENDPDWDHPDDGDNDTLPPGKNPGRKK